MDKTFITGFDSSVNTIWVNLVYIQHVYLRQPLGGKWQITASMENKTTVILAEFDTQEKAAEEMEKVFGKLAAHKSPKPSVGICSGH